eukprot:Hpha_TRINITY_DN23924_c0_g1::TRINITY_DN23924_c0_g1_i1::g.137689::m.137689
MVSEGGSDAENGRSERSSSESPPPSPGTPLWRRVVLVVVVLAGIVLVGKLAGLDKWLQRDRLRALVSQAGIFGPILLALAFSVGELIHIPGIVFVAVGAAAYPTVLACPINFFAALCSVSTTFWVVRGSGGELLGRVRGAWMTRMMARLNDAPVTTVAILRSFLFMAPALNYALALSTISFKNYLLGSAVGLAVPVMAMTVFADTLMAYFFSDTGAKATS